MARVSQRPRSRSGSKATRQGNWVATVDRIVFTMKQRPRRWDQIIDTPAEVGRLVRDMGAFPDDGKEHVGVFLLNAGARVLAWHPLGTGTVDAVIVSPRDVFGPALRWLGVRGVIVVHNHPSGNAEPSQRDIEVTTDLYKAGEILGVALLDHVVVADRPSRNQPAYVSIGEFVKRHGAGAGANKEE